MVAGERSGDVYGGRLAAALKTHAEDLDIFGCGGDLMRAAGVSTSVDARTFAMVGITEIVSGFPRAYRAFHRLLEEVDRRQPSLAVLIDSPSLNMRLARRLKQRAIPVVYFVSPQIWAWKKWRLRQLRGLVDRMVCIFDFEKPIYERVGIPVEYVGHPLVDTVRPLQSRQEFFAGLGLRRDVSTLALLPGSREIELDYILPAMLEAVGELARSRDIQFVLALAPGLDFDRAERRMRKNHAGQFTLRLAPGMAYDALAYSDAAVVASGTATVEAALLACPIVVVYRVAPTTAFFGKFMVDVPFFSMVNLLAGKRVVPELIQKSYTPANLAKEVCRLLDRAEVREAMRQELRAVAAHLGSGGAIDRAADLLLRMLRPIPYGETAIPAQAGTQSLG